MSLITSAQKLLGIHKIRHANKINEYENNFQKLLKILDKRFVKHIKNVEYGEEDFGNFKIKCDTLVDTVDYLKHQSRKDQMLDYFEEKYSKDGYHFTSAFYYPGTFSHLGGTGRELTIHYTVLENKEENNEEVN
jgi:hypothetical protein